ncbi:hypothetical protein BJ875DRAFT_135688 [Amylocarpus encephaloides]|uniref:ubiquitinyl hydrolase 1 n=1 Tax=Amylocarpus encephaloides TaxID=45428 RepID=A0A9P7YD09_9HELO|nr:hypothetical protein BJ875DRAFT_135688 [Amylocarpus encephaloides]
MGCAADLPQRSSSPLKRRASDLEDSDKISNPREDVEMSPAPPAEMVNGAQTERGDPQVGSAEEAGRGPETMNRDSGSRPASQASTEIPSIDAQIKTVTSLVEANLQRQPEEGGKVFLVSRLWLQRVLDRGTEAKQNSKIEPVGEIGPVDNSHIVQQIITDAEGLQFAQLRRGVGSDKFEIFPEDAWDLINEWYGLMPGSIPVVRYAHNTNPDKAGMPNMQYEYNPPVFTIHRLWGDNNPIDIPRVLKANHPPASVLVLSTSTKYVDFLVKIKELSRIDRPKKVQIWRVPRLLPAANPSTAVPNAATPPSSRPSSPVPTAEVASQQPQDSWKHILLDVATFLTLPNGNGREKIDQRDFSADPNYSGGSTLAFVGLAEDQAIVIDEEVDNISYVSTHVSKATKGFPRAGVSQSAPVSGRSSPAPLGPATRGRAKHGKTLGTVGLSNLGNTCYMNSALQCVRSVEELTKYFLTGTATDELNTENPLGNNGQVAIAYARLLDEMYKESVPTSVAPRNFKTTIGKYAPSFSGYGQQDSQEFLGFLLDGLQEDLSRVKKKPYIEKPDSTDEMIGNPEAIRQMAEEVWQITKRRDDSVIADLFTGMYKSTLVCPVCSKVSITFDPFNNLTLQLPIESSWQHQIFYFPLNDPPVTINVDIDKQGSILAMKGFISERVGVPTERLFAAEEFKSKFYKIYVDHDTASEVISGSDVVAVYELEAKPTNWPPRRRSKKNTSRSMLGFGNSNESEEDDVPNWDDLMSEKMLVPVFHRKPNSDRHSRFKRAWVLVPAPHFIVVSPEEARDLDIITRKILEKVATFSTSHLFKEDDEGHTSVSDSIDPDIVLTTGSDADSSGDSKIVATSIDGEDELVDVAMKESSGATGAATSKPGATTPETTRTPSTLKSFPSHRPKYLTPGSYLNPSLQNMFSLGHFSANREMIPSGWNVVDEDKTYPSLVSRVPRPPQSPEGDANGFEAQDSRSESSVEQDTYRSDDFSQQTRMNDPDSSEDELCASRVTRALPVRQRAGVRGNHRPRMLSNANDDLDDVTQDEGPLIRLGEGIVVDWNPEAWESMYDGGGPDDAMRGCDTISNVPALPDPQLEAKRRARQARRKNGITLDDCLNEFGKEEILSEMDTWYCPRCKEHRRASKKFELWRTPDVLVMHLKRFSSIAMRRDKLDVMVDFPVEGLDLSSRVVESEDGKAEIYDLIAVDDHWGGLGGGHYTAFAKSFIDHEWYEYNDSSVSKIKDPQSVVTQSAYLLFYRRRSGVPLGGPKFKQIFETFDNPQNSQEDETRLSGEEQGLGGNTFQSGSSSALIGVGAAPRRTNLGSASVDGVASRETLESLPAYQSHVGNDDDVPLLAGDTVMNDGLPLQNSIEGPEDEGIDVGMNYTNTNLSRGPIGGSWDFANLGQNNARGQISGTGSDEMNDVEDDISSDHAQNNSSASEASIQERMQEWDTSYAEEDIGMPFEDQCPVPDITDDNQVSLVDISTGLLSQRGPIKVDSGLTENEVEEPATEIHVKDGEGWKLE